MMLNRKPREFVRCEGEEPDSKNANHIQETLVDEIASSSERHDMSLDKMASSADQQHLQQTGKWKYDLNYTKILDL